MSVDTVDQPTRTRRRRARRQPKVWTAASERAVEIVRGYIRQLESDAKRDRLRAVRAQGSQRRLW